MDLPQDYIKRLGLYKIDFNQGEFVSIAKEIYELLDVYLEPQEVMEARLILATWYKDIKDNKNAEALYWTIIASSKFDADRMTIARAYRNLSELKYDTGNIKEAEEYRIGGFYKPLIFLILI